MSRIGYDAMAIGNHEFDNGLGIFECLGKFSEILWKIDYFR